MHEDPVEGSPCKDEDDSSIIRIDGDDISSPDILRQKQGIQSQKVTPLKLHLMQSASLLDARQSETHLSPTLVDKEGKNLTLRHAQVEAGCQTDDLVQSEIECQTVNGETEAQESQTPVIETLETGMQIETVLTVDSASQVDHIFQTDSGIQATQSS